LMKGQRTYKVSMEEIHHTQKKDAPSGTAITLAEQILEEINTKTGWVNNETENASLLPIISKRIDPAPGTHSIKYSSSIDDIEIIHTAHSRTGFATGAVLAAEFIAGRKGIFSMRDVLGI
jgi:4-hydroxy-tetrahydrodipicolinate reductase